MFGFYLLTPKGNLDTIKRDEKAFQALAPLKTFYSLYGGQMALHVS